MIKRLIPFLCFFFFTIHLSFAQHTLIKQWDKRFGGINEDDLTCFQQTRDGGYILGGTSSSVAGDDKTQAIQGSDDYWIVKIDSLGNEQWDKDFGGKFDDELFSLQQTRDKGYILGGWSNSDSSGDKTQNSEGDYDYWIVKTDSLGNKQWDKDFGGSQDDQLFSLQQTRDGGYILGGQSQSDSSGDKTQNLKGGLLDYWVVKIDSLGNKEWDKDFGGNNNDQLISLQQTTDGGYILGGSSSSSISGDKTQNTDGIYFDYWIIKIDSRGNKTWDKDFGGSADDELISVLQTRDGGYILGGISASPSGGDKTDSSKGENDYWVIKTDSLGNKQWDKDYGGLSDEYGFGNVFQTQDGGYLIGGTSASNASGNKTENNFGSVQTWIIKTDLAGNKLWDKTIFTQGSNNCIFVQQDKNGNYIVAANAYAGIGGYKTQFSRGSSDYWITQFKDSLCDVPVPGVLTISPQIVCARSGISAILTDSGSIGKIEWFYTEDGYTFSYPLPDTSDSYTTPPIIQKSLGYITELTNGCGIEYSNINGVYIAPLPIPSFKDTITGNQVVFDSESSSSDVVLFKWNFGDSTLITLPDPLHVYKKTGDFNVCLIVYNSFDCSDTLCKMVNITSTGINGIFFSSSISLYPNPASNTLNLSVNGLKGNYQLKIYNVLGQPVGGIHESSLNGNETIPIDLIDFAPGSYELILMNDKEYYSKRFVHVK